MLLYWPLIRYLYLFCFFWVSVEGHIVYFVTRVKLFRGHCHFCLWHHSNADIVLAWNACFIRSCKFVACCNFVWVMQILKGNCVAGAYILVGLAYCVRVFNFFGGECEYRCCQQDQYIRMFVSAKLFYCSADTVRSAAFCAVWFKQWSQRLAHRALHISHTHGLRGPACGPQRHYVGITMTWLD